MKTIRYTFKDKQGNVHQREATFPMKITADKIRKALMHLTKSECSNYLNKSLTIEDAQD
jgi:hypothetical protein